MEAAMQPASLVPVATGVRVNASQTGTGDPLLLIAPTSASLGIWEPMVPALADRHCVIAFDGRGLGQSERGEGPITMASMAADAAAVLDALRIPRAHVFGLSLGSAVAQELALAHPDHVGALVLVGTWGRMDGYMRAISAITHYPWHTGDMDVALAGLSLSFSPQMLDSPDFESMMEEFAPMLPQTETQIQTTVEQLAADLAHDTLDRLGDIRAPTLVIAGEQDIFTPPWHGQAVADRIPGARFELFTGPGSSHALPMERAEEFLSLVLGFLADHALA